MASDFEGFVAEDREFDTIFVNAAGEPDRDRARTDSLRDCERRDDDHLAAARRAADSRRSSSKHRAIVGAIAAGDRARARTC